MKYIANIRMGVLLTLALVLTGCLDSGDGSGFEVAVPEISFETGALTVAKEGGELTVRLQSNLPWRIASDEPWITFPVENGAAGGEVTLSVQRNRTTEPRTAIVTAYITDGAEARIEVTQEPAADSDTYIYYVKVDGDPLASGLSWDEATTLATALDAAGNGDRICLAAGTYTPVALIMGGESPEERTFEIHSNFTLEGGYPADAADGAVADPAANETVLSGNMGGVSAYHVVAVTAPKSATHRAVLRNLTITGGVGHTVHDELKRYAGGANMDASMGGGISVGAVNLDIVDCRISDNEAIHSGGVHIYPGADVRMERCTITANTARTNGGGVWNSGGAVWMNQCTISGNVSGEQAAGYYSIDAGGAKSVSRIYNSTFSDNDNTRTTALRSGGGAYIRAGSDAVFVNCTFTGNKAGYGGGITGHGTASLASITVCISCTFTANIANAGGGALFAYNDFAEIIAYNTIVSGNSGPAASVDTGVYSGVDASRVRTLSSINGSQLTDGAGGAVGGWTFDAGTMLGPLGYHDGGTTRTYPLVVSAQNPAVSGGLQASELCQLAVSFSPALDEELLASDQNTTARTGSSIGATTAQ